MIPILNVTYRVVVDAPSPPGPDEVVAGVRARLGANAGRVTDLDIVAAVESLIFARLIRVTWDGQAVERSAAPLPELALSEDVERAFWRGRRARKKAAR